MDADPFTALAAAIGPLSQLAGRLIRWPADPAFRPIAVGGAAAAYWGVRMVEWLFWAVGEILINSRVTRAAIEDLAGQGMGEDGGRGSRATGHPEDDRDGTHRVAGRRRAVVLVCRPAGMRGRAGRGVRRVG